LGAVAATWVQPLPTDRQVAGVGHDRLLRSPTRPPTLATRRSQLCPPSPEVAMPVESISGFAEVTSPSATPPLSDGQSTAFSSPAAPRECLVQVAPPLPVVSAPTPTTTQCAGPG